MNWAFSLRRGAPGQLPWAPSEGQRALANLSSGQSIASATHHYHHRHLSLRRIAITIVKMEPERSENLSQRRYRPVDRHGGSLHSTGASGSTQHPAPPVDDPRPRTPPTVSEWASDVGASGSPVDPSLPATSPSDVASSVDARGPPFISTPIPWTPLTSSSNFVAVDPPGNQRAHQPLNPAGCQCANCKKQRRKRRWDRR
jgi:hypothetical protein